MNYSVDWDGPGERDREVLYCPICNGSGEHRSRNKPTVALTCYACQGSGLAKDCYESIFTEEEPPRS